MCEDYIAIYCIFICAGSAAVISTNIAKPCPGEVLNVTCVAEGNSQRWRVLRDSTIGTDRVILEKNFGREEVPGTTVELTGLDGHRYKFILISTEYERFTTIVSIVASYLLDNTLLDCAALTFTTTRIKIAGKDIHTLNSIIRSNIAALKLLCGSYAIETFIMQQYLISQTTWYTR